MVIESCIAEKSALNVNIENFCRSVYILYSIIKHMELATVGEKSIAPPPIFDTPNSYLLYNKLDENIFKLIKILHDCTPIYNALIYVIYFI